MSNTYHELINKMLYSLDNYEMLEILEITAEELADRFEDKIMANFDKLEEYLEK
jgi:hypothetical protein